uniref:DUF8040 domain-containing protein n=1 Tax=Cajanus cajan TaxID=3821 RepID=A0A151QL97_CAJCA|nr:hypothetical protein KK1_049097 [Cajanus cajan]
MYPNVFRKLCAILRVKTPLDLTRYICVEEMFASFLQIVGQNTRYCVIRNTFGRSQFATNENFHKILKALNMIAPTLMAKLGSTMPTKIRESTRFFPFFKKLVLACATLHNFLRKKYCSDEFLIEAVDEPSSSTLPVNEDHTFEPIIQTQEQE